MSNLRAHCSANSVTVGAMTDEIIKLIPEWLSVPEFAQALGVNLRTVRQMVADRTVVTARVGENNAVHIPAAFLQDGSLLEHLPGTITVLFDGGLHEEEVLRWLFTKDETLPIPGAPIDMLHAGYRAEVRKRAAEQAW